MANAVLVPPMSPASNINLLLHTCFSDLGAAPPCVTCSALPPSLGLHSVRKAVGSGLIRNSTDEAHQSFGPVPVGEKSPQYGATEELSSGVDLWSYRELTKPAVIEVLTTPDPVKASLKC